MHNTKFLLNALLVPATLILLTSLLTTGCKNMDTEKRFDWSATLSAPEEYPVRVYKGAMLAKDYQQTLTGFGDIGTGWGEYSASVIMGPDLKSLPDSLAVAWHSFVDQKQYEGKWSLPKDKIEKLFDDGYIDIATNKKTTYNTFIIGLAPNGLVVLWLSAAGSQIEVAHFTAQETAVDMDNLHQDAHRIFAKDYNDIVLAQLNEKLNTQKRIENNTYPKIGLYQDYRKRYFWRPDIILPDKHTLDSFVLQTHNGEIEIESSKKTPLTIKHKERGIIKSFSFSWADKNQKKIATCWLEGFNETELLNAYDNFDNTEEIELSVTATDSKNIIVALKNSNKEIQITTFKSTVEKSL